MYRFAIALLLWVTVSCSKPWPEIEPLAVEPLSPESEEWRVIDHVVVVTDASGTMGMEGLLPEAREITRSLVSGMPGLSTRSEGAPEYKASLIVFGGDERRTVAHDVFDRRSLLREVAKLRPLGGPPMGGATPLADVIEEAAGSLAGERGPTALVIIGDGRATEPASAVTATRRLVSSYPDPVCIHAVHTGDSSEGRSLLQQLVRLSSEGCGSLRSGRDVADVAAVGNLERDVFLGAAPEPPPVAAGPPPESACEQRVVLRGVSFELDRAVLRPESHSVLDQAAEQLRQCPDRQVMVEGHTCSLGADTYNLNLSERRAAAVRDYLVDQGVTPGQLETRGVGEAQPLADNRTEGGRAQNRRVELIPGD